MNLSMTAGIVLTMAAFAMGFCMARVSLCAVATTQKLIMQRDVSGVAALALAAASAGLVLSLLHWLQPAGTAEPYGPGINAALLMGGVLLACGALLNGGCYVSSVSYVGTGNYHYLLTLTGLYLAARYLHPIASAAGSHTQPFALPLAGVALFAAIIGLCIWRERTALCATRPSLRGGWSWPIAAAGCGLLAAVIATLVPHWSYTKPIEMLASDHTARFSWSLVSSAVAIFAGAACSAHLAGTFRWVRFSPLKALRCLAGGMLMGFATAHIPGGNDTLLLWAIPALAVYGFIAYPIMLATLCVAWLLQRAAGKRHGADQRE